jgi:hypothetical protein
MASFLANRALLGHDPGVEPRLRRRGGRVHLLLLWAGLVGLASGSRQVASSMASAGESYCQQARPPGRCKGSVLVYATGHPGVFSIESVEEASNLLEHSPKVVIAFHAPWSPASRLAVQALSDARREAPLKEVVRTQVA